MRGYYYYYYNIVLLMINIVVQLWNKLPGEVVSANSVSALILRLNSVHVSFLMFCFSAVCLFSLRILEQFYVLSEPFCPVLLFTVFNVLYLCW